MHAGKKQSRRMKGGMTTGQWGTAVYGDSSSQQAVGAGSNVIRMHDPNSVVAALPMKGGRKLKGGDLLESVTGMFASKETPDAAPTPETSSGMFDSVTGLFKSDPAEETATVPDAAPVPPAAAAMGGKGKRKSATKRRKSHKKKGKSSKKRAHKRH